MISQQGRVVRVKGNDVVVHIGAVGGCPACDAGKGCGAGIFGRLLRNRTVNIKVENTIGASGGQSVKLGISDQQFLRFVFRLYVWPLLAGLSGVAIGFVMAVQTGQTGLVPDLAGLFFGITCAGFALLLSRRKSREFPYNSEVHLLNDANEDTESQCAMSMNAPNRPLFEYDKLDQEK